MSTRATNTTLFFLVVLQFLTGSGSLLVGAPSGQWVARLHDAGGFALAILLVWKGRIIVRALRRRGVGLWSAPALTLLALLLLTLMIGFAWSSVSFPAVAAYPALTVHALLAVAMLPLFVPHVRLRWRRVRMSDLAGRRLLLRRGALLAGGGVTWLLAEGASRAAGWSGAARRFTGSRVVTAAGPNGFPVTSWLNDDPEPLNPETWRLRVGGQVERTLLLSRSDLIDGDTLRAVIDCTGGWYADRWWQGVTLGTLLDQAGIRPGVRSVVVRSTTGYWRRLPLAEARRALLATRVDGEPLSHGHGAPARLVAPGRRGYEWVKWVAEIEASERGPLWKWPLPLT